ncbi:NB-ARC domain-containing protein [Streptomyces violaceusniger]|uniref:AAA+ ATPase domain-containing protein n=1 Tax=Streptomyces violaceusniger TaxID=68280 RepID=A0A4D4L9A3_STRVO|nr:hypothetical protein SVIO_075570 [Streptomyces violaceusniger]
MVSDALPNPSEALTAAEYVAQLRQLKAWSGLSYRELERRAREAGDVLPYSTAASMLGRPGMPREALVASFVRACGAGGEVERWLAVRKRLAVRYEPVAGASGGVPVPAELPRDVPAFTGREAELAALRRPSRRPAGAGAVSLISGRAGVGKTALAVRLAHQIADRYPDGHLFLRLGGSGPRGTSVPPKDALALLLRALGAAPAAPPESVEQSVAAYRGSLAGRRVLIILDDAGSFAQVRPLLPATPSCRVIVTSRGPLSGLAAGDGAHRMSLEAFSDAEAVSSLARAGAAGRLTAEPGAALRVARMCGRLPLALSIAGAFLAGRPGMSVGSLADRLAAERRRAEAAAPADEDSVAVRAVLSLVYRTLPPRGARLFRLLGLHPEPECDAAVAGALLGVRPPEARRLLRALADVRLLTEPVAERYGLHELTRAYASDRAAVDESWEGRSQALCRLYRHTTGGFPANAATTGGFPANAAEQPLECGQDMRTRAPLEIIADLERLFAEVAKGTAELKGMLLDRD